MTYKKILNKMSGSAFRSGVGLLICMCAWGQPVYANTPLEIHFGEVNGQVQVMPQDAFEWAPAKTLMKLAQGDHVKTSAGAFAEIIFEGDHHIYLKENTSFIIDEHTRDTNNVAKIRTTLNIGNLMSRVAKLKGKDVFVVKTPNAIAGVRGTIFYLKVYQVQSDTKTSSQLGEIEPSLLAAAKERVFGFYRYVTFSPQNCYAVSNGQTITDLYVDDGAVNFENLLTGASYLVDQGNGSKSYDDGRVDEPREATDEQKQQWREGYESSASTQQGQTSETQTQNQTQETTIVEETDDLTDETDIADPEGNDNSQEDPDTRDDRNENNEADEDEDEGDDPEPIVLDRDGDGVNDDDDAFPDDPNETTDSDGDGVGDNADEFLNDPTIWTDIERNELRSELRELMEIDQLANLDAEIERRQDFETHKIMRDRFGHLVRSKQYVFVNGSEFQMVSLTQRRVSTNAGVSSLTLDVSFNQSIENTSLPDLFIFNDDNEFDGSMFFPPTGPQDGAEIFASEPEFYYTDFDLTFKNPQGDFAEFNETLDPVLQHLSWEANEFFQGHSAGEFWFQEFVSEEVIVNNTVFNTLDEPLVEASYYSFSNEFNQNIFNIDFTDAEGHSLTAQFYVINDEGTVLDPAGIFDHLANEHADEAFILDGIGDFLFEGLLTNNLEINLAINLDPNDSESPVLDFDVILAPEIFVPYIGPNLGP